MTIMATHFAIVLGAWRLRIRIDIDEPRDVAPVSTQRAPRFKHRTLRAASRFAGDR